MKLFGFLLLLLIPIVASADVWTVEHPGDDVPGIVQGVVDLMADGDTLLVGPGSFRENLKIRKSIALIGSSLDSTTIEAAAKGSVVYIEALAPEVSISAMTITGGTGIQLGFVTVGGGVALVTGGTGRLSIMASRIHDNEADAGGGVFVEGATSLLMDSCQFDNNRGWSNGGVLYASQMDTVQMTRSRVTIEPTSGNRRPGLLIVGSGFVEVSDNLLLGPDDGREVSEVGFDLEAHTVEFHDNLVVDRGDAVVASRGALGGPGNRPEPFNVDARRNVFARESTSHPGATLTLVANGRPVSFINNTLSRVPVRLVTVGADTTHVSSNIFAEGSFTHVSGPLVYECNDNWESSFRTEDEVVVRRADNFSADPQFCGTGEDTLSLGRDSPCLPENATGDCGLVGARAHCALVPVIVDGLFVIEECEELVFGWRNAAAIPGTTWTLVQKCANEERVIATGAVRADSYEGRASHLSCDDEKAAYKLLVGKYEVITKARQNCIVRGLAVRPNPTTGPVEFARRRSTTQSAVRVVDAVGRLVATLEPGQNTWSLKDHDGNAVPSGIYYAVDASNEATSITVIR